MLRFLHPVMTQQALELRVEVFVIANAFEIMVRMLRILSFTILSLRAQESFDSMVTCN